MPNNFAQFVIDSNQSRLDKIALVDEEASLTYRDLANHIRSFGYHLQQSGVQPQNRVIISMEDCVAWPVAFLSILAVGGNPVLVGDDLPMSIVEKVCKIADAKFVIGKEIAYLTCFHKQTIQAGLEHQLTDFYQYHPDEICFWLLSSGTTGEPKCVVHRHSDLKTLLDVIAWPAYQIDKNSRILSTAKLSFTYGFNNSLTFGLGMGSTVYLINGVPAPTKVYQLVNEKQITHLFTVPTVINSMIKHGADQTLSTSVKVMVSSGEPLPASVATQFQQRHDITILDGLGMSECMYNYCTTTLENNEFGTIGRPVAGVECKVCDDFGNTTPVGMVGEMWVKHPCAALQYWKDWNNTKTTFIGEWIKTGDKVIQQPNGNYLYVSRKDDLIKINGQFVSPTEIENVVLALDWVVDCGVVADLGEKGLYEIHAFITTKRPATSQELKSALANTLPSYKVPKYVHFIDFIPKTVTGKKTRAVLRHKINAYLEKL
jgi:benzoate-CoA ligase